MKQQELRPARRQREPLIIVVPSHEPSAKDKLRLEQAVLKIAQLIVRQIAREGTTLILITHHVDEIVPEIDRVILLREGRVVAAGPKRSVLTAERLSGLFNAPITLEEHDGYYYARPTG